jgi:hypothetical protein
MKHEIHIARQFLAQGEIRQITEDVLRSRIHGDAIQRHDSDPRPGIRKHSYYLATDQTRAARNQRIAICKALQNIFTYHFVIHLVVVD